MSKEEYEKLKAELKEELRKEMSNKKESGGTYWNMYTTNELVPKIENKGYSKYKTLNSISYFARAITGVNTVFKLTQEDIEKIKPVIDEIINIIPDLKEVKQ